MRISVSTCLALGILGCQVYDPGLLDASPPRPPPPDGMGDAAPGDDADADRPDPDAGRPPDGGPDATVDAGADAGPGVVTCGNGRIDAPERCDIGLGTAQAGACPTECPPLSACMLQQVVGTLCDTHCQPLPLECVADDGCCPAGCTAANDSDCSGACGDGIVQDAEGETCEPESETPCQSEADCDDGNPCTQDVLSGSEANCNTSCDNVPIVELRPDDQCCPRDVGANANNDNDCAPTCGNDVVEQGEECDGPVGCNEQCELTMTPEQLRCLEDYPADACRQCECIECTQLALDCFDSGNATIDMHCTAVETCGRESDCANRVCYCGTDLICLFPNGPCRDVIERAAGTTVPLEVDREANTPGTALYRADQLAYCSVERCSNVCP